MSDCLDLHVSMLTIAHSIMTKEIPSLKKESAQHAIMQSKTLLSTIDGMLQDSLSGWILDTPHPTALDAHVIVFIARLKDAGRSELVPTLTTDYADRAMVTPAWKDMMQGRQTVPPGGF